MKKEFKRICKKCQKTWYSSIGVENNLTITSALNLVSGFLSIISFDFTSSAQSRRNTETANDNLDDLKRCPNCGSSDYEEAIENGTVNIPKVIIHKDTLSNTIFAYTVIFFIFFGIPISLIAYGCHVNNENILLTNANIQKIYQIEQNEKKRIQTLKLKSRTKYKVYLTKKFGNDFEEKIKIGYSIYDDSGNITRNITYREKSKNSFITSDVDNLIETDETYKYDNQGNKIETQPTTVKKIKNDSYGNIVEEIIYDRYTGHQKHRYTYDYKDYGKQVIQNVYTSQNSFLQTNYKIYNDNLYLKETYYSGMLGLLTCDRHTYEYDQFCNLIKETITGIEHLKYVYEYEYFTNNIKNDTPISESTDCVK